MINCTSYFAQQVVALEHAVRAAELQRAAEARMMPDGSRGAERSRAIGLANRQRVLDWIKDNPRCNRKEIAGALGLAEKVAGQHVSNLVQDGRVENIGSRCRAAYVVAER